MDSDVRPFDESELQRWDMTVETVMPHKSFAYWCTIHRTPRVTQKHHIVGVSGFTNISTYLCIILLQLQIRFIHGLIQFTVQTLY